MFGLGFGELVLLLILGAILIGPKELPGLLKSVSRFTKQLTGARDEWVKTIREDPSIRDITDSIDEVKGAIEKPVISLEEAIREELAKQEDQKKQEDEKKSKEPK